MIRGTFISLQLLSTKQLRSVPGIEMFHPFAVPGWDEWKDIMAVPPSSCSSCSLRLSHPKFSIRCSFLSGEWTMKPHRGLSEKLPHLFCTAQAGSSPWNHRMG